MIKNFFNNIKSKNKGGEQMKRIFIIVMAFMVVVGMTATAQAIPILTLNDGTTSVSISDGGAGDVNSLAGAVTYVGQVGSFLLNVSTGVTKPLIGDIDKPELDLHSVNVVSTGSGTLTITFTEDGFGPVASWVKGFYTAIGGTTQGTVSLESRLNSTTLSLLGPYSSNAFAGDTSTLVTNIPDTFSLSLIATVHHDGAGITSFDSSVQAVPEPSTFLLFGAGLLGVGFLRKRFKK